MIHPNRERYLRSLADELSAQSQRVRDLIGDRHWLTDGTHKEFLLAEIIRRHIPGSHLVARGFIVSPFESDVCSREQDILIVDTSSEAPVFHQGGVVITFPGAVRGAISVKTTLGKKEVLDAAETLASARRIAVRSGTDPATLWTGAYFLDASTAVQAKPDAVYEYLEEAIRSQCGAAGDLVGTGAGPDLVATAARFAFRLYRNDDESAKIVGFDCSGLASAVFMAHLLDHLAAHRGMVRADFADFADSPSVHLLDNPEYVFGLGSQGT